MNLDKSQKSPNKKNPVASSSSSEYARKTRRNTLSATSRDETDRKINLSDFLEFLRVSCHLNDLITKNETTQSAALSPLSMSRNPSRAQLTSNNNNTHANGYNRAKGAQPPSGGTARKASPTNEIDLVRLAQSRVIDGFLMSGQASKHNPDSKEVGCNAEEDRPEEPGATKSSVTIRADSTRNSSSNFLNDSAVTMQASARMASPVGATASPNFGADESTSTSTTTTSNGLSAELSNKLDYVINEGVLDALLPFICPVALPLSFLNRSKPKGKEPAHSKPAANGPAADAATSPAEPAAIETDSAKPDLGKVTTKPKEATILKQTPARRKSLFGPNRSDSMNLLVAKREPEVVIHVCDEVKNVSKDFSCPQSLLVDKMGYFADVTAGQKLDDMDISVHCDIHIFDWLMKWVKHTAVQEQNALSSSPVVGFEQGPQLDACNVVPILVSASFLQMEPLLEDCLAFCHARLNDVVRTSTNLACLNDTIVTRLAAMFTNIELEMVRDKKERVTPRLWTKLIQSLCEPEPEALRGHYYSLSGLFRCVKCGHCLTNTIKEYVSCVAGNIRLNRWGQLVSHHVRDPEWDINVYITQLFRELKSWRRVYWKLWGHCHFLYCCLCETHFPVHQMTWCRYHPESPNFLGPMSEGCVPGPTGRHPCCGQQAFRYETLPGLNGCQFREHSVLVETDRERAIHSISQMLAEGKALCDNPPEHRLELLTGQRSNSEYRWEGLALMPQRYRLGLLPTLHPDDLKERLGRASRTLSSYFEQSSSESEDTTDTVDESRRFRNRNLPSGNYTSSSSDGCESECDIPKSMARKPPSKKSTKRRPTEVQGRFWSGDLSARSNQDYQRDFEEKIMKHVINLVNKKSNGEHGANCPTSSQPAGGMFIRLEAEWREMVKQRHSNTAMVHPNGPATRQHRKI